MHFEHGSSYGGLRNFSYGTVNLVISQQGKPKFETREIEPPKKDKWKTKKRLKMQRKREKQKRKAANKRDPRRLTGKKKKQRFANAEERIKYKIEQVRKDKKTFDHSIWILGKTSVFWAFVIFICGFFCLVCLLWVPNVKLLVNFSLWCDLICAI